VRGIARLVKAADAVNRFFLKDPDHVEKMPLAARAAAWETAPFESISHPRVRTSSPERISVSRWRPSIATSVGGRKGRMASTWASGTGRTGSVSGAADRPRCSPLTHWRPW
jgi:hypothetical protein